MFLHLHHPTHNIPYPRLFSADRAVTARRAEQRPPHLCPGATPHPISRSSTHTEIHYYSTSPGSSSPVAQPGSKLTECSPSCPEAETVESSAPRRRPA